MNKTTANIEKNNNSKENKKASVIADALFYAVSIVAVIVVFTFSRSGTSHFKVSGYYLFEVLTSSMKSVYPRGSVIIVKEVPVNELAVGDDITFVREDNNIITHRIDEIKEDYQGSGQSVFVTKGVDNATVDDAVVLSDNVIGKVVKSFPRLGSIVSWLRENLLTVVIFFGALMACSFFIKIFRQARKEVETPL